MVAILTAPGTTSDAPAAAAGVRRQLHLDRSEEHTSELQSLMRNSNAVFCFNNTQHTNIIPTQPPLPQPYTLPSTAPARAAACAPTARARRSDILFLATPRRRPT